MRRLILPSSISDLCTARFGLTGAIAGVLSLAANFLLTLEGGIPAIPAIALLHIELAGPFVALVFCSYSLFVERPKLVALIGLCLVAATKGWIFWASEFLKQGASGRWPVLSLVLLLVPVVLVLHCAKTVRQHLRKAKRADHVIYGIRLSTLANTSAGMALCALLWLGLFRMLIMLFPPAPGRASPLTGRAGGIILLSAFALMLAAVIAFIAGVVAIILLIRRGGTRWDWGFALGGVFICVALWGFEKASSPGSHELRAEVPIAQGTANGTFTLYSNSLVITTGTFENGRREGVWTFRDAHGSKTRETTYKHDLKEGSALGWASSLTPDETARGKPLYEGTFSANRLDGEWIFYYPATGQVRCKFFFDHGDAKSARCWSQGGGELAPTEALNEAHKERIYVEGYLRALDETVEKGMQQLLRTTSRQ